jgi:hypothetical protein
VPPALGAAVHERAGAPRHHSRVRAVWKVHRQLDPVLLTEVPDGAVE